MDNKGEVVYLDLDDIIPNRFQPREVFDDQALKELAVSIKEHGVIQPIIVRKVDNKYEIIAGERRYKASTMAGLTKIPAIVKNLDDKESSKVALIENLQRKDLTPIEEARTYQKILEIDSDMTQEQLAANIGKTQSSVSNKLRLLALPDEIQDALLKEKISERHARSLLNIEDKNDQIKMLEKIISEKLTVRDLDKEIRMLKGEIDEQPAPQTNNEVEKVNNTNLLSAIDITTSIPKNEEENISPMPQTPPPPPIPLADLGNDSSDNPTTVDINKIRENSIDISGLTGNIQKTETTEAPKEEETKTESFKFVPSFNVETEKEDNNNVENKFDNLFNSNVSNENNNLASGVSSFGLSVPNDKMDISGAINDIKNTITELENKGYKVKFEENDEDTNYKITIDLEK